MTIPLSPAQGGRCISVEALQPADLIVSTTSATMSRLIRAATGSLVSHAMVYAGNGEVIEAVTAGVLKRPLEAALARATLAVAYRHNRMTDAIGAAVVGYALQQVGRKYDIGGIVGQAGYQLDHWFLCKVVNVKSCDDRAARATLWVESSRKFFCSELIAEVYKRAGVPLTNTPPRRVSPQRLVEVVYTGKLLYVGHLR